MIFLTATTETLTLVTAAALSLDWSAGYVDIDSTTGATPGSQQGNVTTATSTTVVPAPVASTQRQLKSLTAVNKDAVSTQTVTLNKVTAAGTFALARNVALAPNETLVWVDSIGFQVLDALGVHKVANTLVNVGTGVTGTLQVGNGGTGIASYTVGDILYASGAAALSKLADVVTGNALISGGVGVAPAWGKIALTTHVSGTLPVANGGTGITSLGTGVATWLGTPSSANLLAAMTDETGTGALVFANTPTLVTPAIGAATGASVNLTSTATASAFIPTGSTIPANGLYLPAANTLALATNTTERVHVGSSGNVGIGGTPTNKVTVFTAGSADALRIVGADSFITFYNTANTTRAGYIAAGSAGVDVTAETGASNTIRLVTNATERVRVDSSGNVGIGVTAAAKLNVQGGDVVATLTDWNSKACAQFNLANPAVHFGIGYTAADIVELQGYDSANASKHIAMQRLGGSVGIGGTPDATYKLDVNGALSISSATMIRTATSFTNGAAAAAGTLTNAPTAGNPTKWVPIVDNGTTRYIPAW